MIFQKYKIAQAILIVILILFTSFSAHYSAYSLTNIKVSEPKSKAISINSASLNKRTLESANLSTSGITKIQSNVNKKNNGIIKHVLLNTFYALFITLILIAAFRLYRIIFRKIIGKLNSWKGTIIKPFVIQRFELLPVSRVIDIIILGLKIIGIVIGFALIYIYLTLVFSLFPQTVIYSENLQKYFFLIIASIWYTFLIYLPDLFFIAIVITITYYINRFVRIIFREICRGTINIPGFYREWADSTSKIVRFFIIAMALVIILPHFPGWESEAFRALSIFFGIIVSFGSSSAVSNMIAGIILTYTRAFKSGDRLKIGNTIGDVMEKTLLVTRIRTIKYEIISIPNAVVLSSHIVNYSIEAPGPGIILHTTISISYSVPHKQIEELLLNAADLTINVKKDPVPFVLMTKLDDFYINYELNVYTDKPTLMQNTYSDLHKNIYNSFNQAGIEIMSPHFTAIRDGNKIEIPEKCIKENYIPSAFRIFSAEKNENIDINETSSEQN